MQGGHSLEAWGERLKKLKGHYDDWTQLTDEMVTYCEQDVEVTLELFTKLTARMRRVGFSELSCEIEHNIRLIIDEQQRNGFYFDIPAAQSLFDELREKERRLAVSIRELFPPLLVSQGTYNYRLTQSGTPYASFERHRTKYPEIKFDPSGTTYDVFDYQEFNLGSPKQRVERLVAMGYKPTSFTPTGQPKVDEDSLVDFAKLSGQKEVAELASWLVANGRANMLGTWLNAVNRDDSCMHGTVNSCGAGTRRMTHSSPNTANIPGLEVEYGPEVRALWQARPGRLEVGADAKACQMRMFGHYLNNEETAKKYWDTENYGDPHLNNAIAFGDESKRKKAKNVFFAFIFGAQPPKLASTWGVSERHGKALRKTLFDNNPGLEALISEVTSEYSSNAGWLRCIDGGYVRCPSPHAALNYRIQSAEKVQMARAAIIADAEIKRKGLDVLWVGNIHDEWQTDCDPRDAEEWGNTAVQALRDAGEELGFKVPMDGSYAVGRNWQECH